MGMYCPFEESAPRNCTPGHYCGFGSFVPTACPKGTYQPLERMGHLIDCRPCEAGYHCFEAGIGNLVAFDNLYDCPEGKYCPAGINIEPVPCIAGSYIDDRTSPTQAISFEQVFLGSSSKPDSIDDCSFCPQGYVCEKGTGDRYTKPCPPGYICPAGTGIPKVCPPGWYCEGNETPDSIESAECPEGFYCPAKTAVPIPCDATSVCPRKSSSPETRGMTPKDCEPGTYLNVDRCAPCEEGHVCDKETSQKYPLYLETEGGFECPPGHFCPRGTTLETIKKCPVGTHRLNPKGKSLDDCTPCPDGSAQNREGQAVCILCGQGSEASEDRSTCNCIGAFRTW